MRVYNKMVVNGEIYYQHSKLKNVFLFLLNDRRISKVYSLTFDLTPELQQALKEQREISNDNKVFHFAQNTIRRHFYSLLKGFPRIKIHDSIYITSKWYDYC